MCVFSKRYNSAMVGLELRTSGDCPRLRLMIHIYVRVINVLIIITIAVLCVKTWLHA